MVALYIGGEKIEALADALRRLSDPTAERERIELRDESGNVVTRIKIEVAANDPDWVKAITPEEIERRQNGEFLTFDEFKERMGWK